MFSGYVLAQSMVKVPGKVKAEVSPLLTKDVISAFSGEGKNPNFLGQRFSSFPPKICCLQPNVGITFLGLSHLRLSVISLRIKTSPLIILNELKRFCKPYFKRPKSSITSSMSTFLASSLLHDSQHIHSPFA